MHNKLIEIVESTKRRLEEKKQRKPFTLRYSGTRFARTRMTGRFLEAMKKDGMSLIAEIKLASPTAKFSSSLSVVDRVRIYKKGGVDAISVVTEPEFFKGDMTFVTQIKQTVSLPVLQKDFVIDHYQIEEAARLGSDAVLLIAKLVNGETLKEFVTKVQELGVEPVVEINDSEDLEKAANTSTKIIAVNARNLNDFTVDVARACDLLQVIPTIYVRLGFSGIGSAQDVLQYKKAGANGVLIGSALMEAENIEAYIQSLRI